MLILVVPAVFGENLVIDDLKRVTTPFQGVSTLEFLLTVLSLPFQNISLRFS